MLEPSAHVGPVSILGREMMMAFGGGEGMLHWTRLKQPVRGWSTLPGPTRSRVCTQYCVYTTPIRLDETASLRACWPFWTTFLRRTFARTEKRQRKTCQVISVEVLLRRPTLARLECNRSETMRTPDVMIHFILCRSGERTYPGMPPLSPTHARAGFFP